MSLVKSISQFAGLTMVSRVLGFCRDVLMARYLGASLAADAFFVAFKLPNLFRRLFAEGAFNAAFVPLFARELKKDDDRPRHDQGSHAIRFAEESLGILVPFLLIFVAVMQMAMPWVMYVLAPGFADQPEKFALAIEFARSTFPYLLFISLVSLMAGVLNSMQRFAAAAAAPILLNLVLIGALLTFHDTQMVAGQWLARAVSIAGLVQFIWLMIALRRAGVRLKLPRPRITERVKELGVIMLPAALGAGAVQLNLLVDIVLASLLPDGSLSYLFYADRLNQLPIGVIGVAVGTVLLPSLSRSLASGNEVQAATEQNRALESAMFLTLPAAMALIVVPLPLISTLFERGAFDAAATSNTAAALTAYAFGLPAYILVKILTPAYFARKDTRTPVRFALIALAMNVVLNLILMRYFQHVGLAMATAISAWANVFMLYIYLARRDQFRIERRVWGRLIRMLLAAGLMAGFCWWLADGLGHWWTGDLTGRLQALSLMVGGGVLFYGALSHVFGIVRFGQIRAFIRGRGNK